MHVAKCPSPWDQPRLVAPFMMGDIPTPHPHPQTLIWVHEGLCSVEAPWEAAQSPLLPLGSEAFSLLSMTLTGSFLKEDLSLGSSASQRPPCHVPAPKPRQPRLSEWKAFLEGTGWPRGPYGLLKGCCLVSGDV